jgi:hypothetical protein
MLRRNEIEKRMIRTSIKANSLVILKIHKKIGTIMAKMNTNK